MMTKATRRIYRKRRVRAVIHGTPGRPRLSVFRSNRHLVAQLIDDEKGVTLASVSTQAMKDAKGSKTDRARTLGQKIAERAAEKNITTVVFDRNGYKYHGRVAAVADGAREKGLTI